MRVLEIAFWEGIYVASFTLVAMGIDIISGGGSLLGLMFIGAAFGCLLALYLVFQDDVLFDDWDIVAVPTAIPVKAVQRGRPKKIISPEQIKDTNDATEVDQPKKKIGRPRKKIVETITKEEQGVQSHVEETKEKTEDTFPIGIEPEPKIRTDVNLGLLDVDDDGVSS